MLTRRRVMIIAEEVTPGTAVALGASALPVHGLQKTPQTPYIGREPTNGGGRVAGISGARSCQVSFGLHLTTKADASLPAWTGLLPACGMKVASEDWSPTSVPPGGGAGAAKTLTVGVYQDGLLRTIAGAMGNMQISGSSGGLLEARFTLTGKDLDEANQALPAPTYPSAETVVRCAPATLVIGGNAMTLAEFSLDLGNSVQLREGMSDATGYIAAQVVDRSITGSFSIEAKTIGGTYTPHSQYFANTVQAATLTIGTGSAAIVFSLPQLQLTSVPPADRNGTVHDTWNFQACRTQGADDELVIAFGA